MLTPEQEVALGGLETSFSVEIPYEELEDGAIAVSLPDKWHVTIDRWGMVAKRKSPQAQAKEL